MSPVSGISQIAAGRIAETVKPGGNAGEFGSLLEASLQKIEQPRAEANEAVNKLISGDGEELHTALIATQRAELTFELGLQIRNKVVQAYQEIMRMQM
jgi:flagellar hook-basal body complex protein FliE